MIAVKNAAVSKKHLLKGLFYLVLFLLPVNLGKHFIIPEAFVKGFRIDYLIPTIWVTDILLIVLLAGWLITGGIAKIRKNYAKRVLGLLLVVLLPSVVIAPRFIAAVVFLARTALYALFALYIASEVVVKKEFTKIVAILSSSVVLLSVLAFFQWAGQGSVFNNYLFFGEQPYSIFTENIALVNVFGRRAVPVYGTFRHPNVFAGFLAIALFWIYARLLLRDRKIRPWLHRLYKTAFVMGFFALALTFSELATLTLFLGMVFLLLIRRFGHAGIFISLGIVTLLFFLGLFLPVFTELGIFQDDPSVFRRANLEKTAYMILDRHSLFGVGLGNFTVLLEDFLPSSQILRFIQPVHNIFLLVFTESGVFAIVAFFMILFLCMVTLLGQPFGLPAVLFVTILQLLVLGSFDHYLLTIHQTKLLFWLTVGLSLTYTNEDVEVQT